MSPRKEAEELAKKLGVTLSFERANYPNRNGSWADDEILLEAPKDHHWEGGTHEFVLTGSRGDKAIWFEALRDLKEARFERCTAECEWWEEKP